jgi:hypothetical protein
MWGNGGESAYQPAGLGGGAGEGEVEEAVDHLLQLLPLPHEAPRHHPGGKSASNPSDSSRGWLESSSGRSDWAPAGGRRSDLWARRESEREREEGFRFAGSWRGFRLRSCVGLRVAAGGMWSVRVWWGGGCFWKGNFSFLPLFLLVLYHLPFFTW